MTLGEYIRQYRKSNKMNMRDFAEKSGLSKSYISILENNKHPQNKRTPVPSIDTYLKVANAVGVSLNELFAVVNQPVLLRSNENYNDDNVSEPSTTTAPFDKPNRIPVLGSIPAGIPIDAVADVVDWEDIPLDWLDGDSQFFGLKVNGDSMFPEYRDGDTVIIKVQPDCESGQVAAVYVNGYDATLKKVVKNGSTIVLQPLNSEYETKIYDSSMVKIAGVVVELRRTI